MITTCTIGFPRIGRHREMKKALETYWASPNASSRAHLLSTAHAVEADAWTTQRSAGIDLIALDGTLYDHVLDTTAYLGLLPSRFGHIPSKLDRYFAAARGSSSSPSSPSSTPALDLSKFFDTTYHYLAPELSPDSHPSPDWSPFIDRVSRGQAAVGKAHAVPILFGPLSFVALARGTFDSSEMVKRLLGAYVEVLTQLKLMGVPEVQIHEPVLATGNKANALHADAVSVYTTLASSVDLPIHLVVPYDDVDEAVYLWLIDLPVHAIGLDFCGVPGASHGCTTAQLIHRHGFPATKRLGAGVIDGRSVWAATDTNGLALVAALRRALGPDQPMTVQSSVSLQHVPMDLTLEESNLSPALRSILAFAVQKLDEIVRICRRLQEIESHGEYNKEGTPAPLDLSTYTTIGSNDNKDKYNDYLAAKERIGREMFERSLPYPARRPLQPSFHPFPTTTIGSFPQTPEIRRARLLFKQGKISAEEYSERMAAFIGHAVGVQDALGLDVLVHGEPERTDMVECFGIKLRGFEFTLHGWVQSYGSRYVRPPIITGEVTRGADPMTVREYVIAQSVVNNKKPVKGMLTGAVTILNWSFPRKDISRSTQAFQIALALRQEVADLEAAGCGIIQVDEPALREGLPLKERRWEEYLEWATAAFRLSTGCAAPATQIVTHLCYSEFEDIMGAIDALDADVLTIENSRSGNEMIKALAVYGYGRDIGPGCYDVHSPVTPSVEFLVDKLRSFLATGILDGDATRIHVNPDCGLKTRRWEEVIPALRNMVEAARIVRAEVRQQEK